MPTIDELLRKSRNELLDLSTRNRLLSIPVTSKSARIIQVLDEVSEEVFRLLTAPEKKERKSFSFAPGKPSPKNGPWAPALPEQEEEELGLPQPDEETDPKTGLPKRHVDSRLQTTLTPEGLQRRLLDLYRDARTMIEEQGVNILYLALGQLKWFEADRADIPRHAPLILVPVQLNRKSASERFTLSWTEEEVEENLSLRAKLAADFGIEMPPFPEEEKSDLNSYFRSLAEAIGSRPHWEVLPNAIVLGFFSFAKFLMYRDLDPENWPAPEDLTEQRFIRSLLLDGFAETEPLLPDDANLDELIPASRLDHVVDADGSQSLAIEAVRQGRSMIIQGPPGTGKSQSITNIIALAALEGKRVLFVAEKLAALEVVKRRLVREGLGPLCLELHSNKSNKRAVIEELGQTWKLGRPKPDDLESLVPKLEARREILNRHAAVLHEAHSPSGLTPFMVIGHLSVLGEAGMEASEIAFCGAEQWSQDQCRSHRGLIEELAERIGQIGIPAQHPWRGVCRETVLNVDLDSLLKIIRGLERKTAELQETSKALGQHLSQPVPSNLLATDQQRVIGQFIVQAPKLDKMAIANPVWDAELDQLQDLLEQGRKFSAACQEVGGRVVETVWDQDFSQARASVAGYGKSLFRFLNGGYRRAIAEIRGSLLGELPKSHAERLSLIDALVSGQQALRRIRDCDSLALSAFGEVWRGEKSDWHALQAVVDWIREQAKAGLGASFRQLFAGLEPSAEIAPLVEELSRRLADVRETASKLFQDLALDCSVAFAVPDLDQVELSALRERCQIWIDKAEELSRWNGWFVRARAAKESGLGPLIELLESGEVSASSASVCFDRIYFSQVIREMVRQKPELARFDGEIHNRHVAEFRQLDSERLALAKYRTLIAHFERMPPLNAGVGPSGIVKAEMERKRGHRTVRRLLKDAGSVVQAIKPVFMMSPLSVAQFLAPGAVEFDLLVMDEASQVQPVDALGAVARAKQIVVVGDSKQLPPTRFFARLTSSEDFEEEEEFQPQAAQAQDLESILGLCRARGLQEKMLRWHYRSRHHSLIAVSNHEFYENKLCIVPSPFSAAAGLGLQLTHVPDGVFDSGASGANRIEAKAVCRAVIEHARNDPKLSLGVAAFSVRQQQAILDELELLRRENPDTEPFFGSDGPEPFFVKNLENVQGDERDVIFISVGYGKDVRGFLAMRFGPLSNEGGERRLNVLISRAKKRCRVFSSIVADDIDLQRASGRGVSALKTFLAFSQTGKLALAEPSGEKSDLLFEEAVRRSVESLGYEVHPRVGVAGFYVDLAVLDRKREGRYLLGIECDGASYCASRSARDRDRLRQAVLEDHGWILHRVWSTDWFQRPAEQLGKIAQALDRAESALEELDAAAGPTPKQIDTEEPVELIERESALDSNDGGLASLSRPYQEAKLEVPKGVEPHELPTAELAEIVFRVVEIEGPIHEDEAVNRIRNLWGYGRAGSRIQDAVAKAIRLLLVTQRCSREDGFLSAPNTQAIIRNRASVSAASLRKPEMLPPAEIRAAILAVIEAGHGAAPQEIVTAVARLFGFKSAGLQLRSAIEAQRNKLASQGVIEEVNGIWRRKESAPEIQ